MFLFLSKFSGAFAYFFISLNMYRSLDSALDNLLSDINRLNVVAVVNNSVGESVGEVISTQHLLGAEVALFYLPK